MIIGCIWVRVPGDGLEAVTAMGYCFFSLLSEFIYVNLLIVYIINANN